MKKPLILLVDDDPAVLQALESELAPLFEEICRIEAFDDPRDVLAAVPRWEEESRPIAVAVVDQKMPGMNGVALLTALRGARPAQCMHSVILTGYAGLDSALEAKNEAGVDGYLEKPWRPSTLRVVVRDLMKRHLADSGASTYLTIHEATAYEDIVPLLRKRYAIYRQSVMKGFCQPTPHEIDFDGWDLWAQHFGLFRNAEKDEVPAGYLRVVHDKQSCLYSLSQKLQEDFPELSPRLTLPANCPLPLLSYFPDVEIVRALYDDILSRGELVAEPGRLSVDPTVRNLGVAVFMAQTATAVFFFFFGIDHALLTCRPPHRRLYEPLGFRQVPGTRARECPPYMGTIICMLGSQREVPEPNLSAVKCLNTRFSRTGETCHCATFPACLPGPYESGEFRQTDLFCPLLARELLQGRRADDLSETAAPQGTAPSP